MHDTLIEAETLLAQHGSTRYCIVDCRASLGDPAAGRRAWEAGHIPGAVHADLETDLSGPVNRGKTGRHPLPDPAILGATLGRWGLDGEMQLIAYDDNGGAFAARLWWLARWLGHRAVAVLNGGLATWREAGGALSTASVLPDPKRFVRGPALTRTVDAADMLHLADTALLDARAEARYAGRSEPIDPVAGHIPGAICASFEGNLDTNGRFLPAAALRARFLDLLAGRGGAACYCGSGVTACHNVLALNIAGFPEPALYAGSWSEWITDPRRPIA